MPHSPRGREPRRLLVSLLVGTLIPAAALAWLSWRILDQDRALERQRVQDGLERASDLTAAALARNLSDVEDRLLLLWDAARTTFPDDAVVVAFGSSHVDVRPAGRLPYWPLAAAPDEPSSSLWSAGEAFEFRDRDPARALRAFGELARSTDPLVRAGALVRVGRNLRKLHRHDEALATYAELEQLTGASVAGTPADLLAREARCAVLEEMGNTRELQAAAVSLRADLVSGRWKLDRVGYQFHMQQTHRLSGNGANKPGSSSALAHAAAVDWLWQQWPAIQRNELTARGRRSLWMNGEPVLVIWRRTSDKLLALVAGREYLRVEWGSLWREQGTVVALADLEGHPVLGVAPPPSAPQAVRAAADTGLPWTMRVASGDPAAGTADTRTRRQLLLTGLGILAFIVVTAGYAAFRAASREVAVARLQSDFVSAVSHEFRTPLTSMRHLTELLRDDVVRDEPRRHEYYHVLVRETERLQRLVEGLLDFGRMEAGAHEYRFESISPASIVNDVVSAFREKLGGAERGVIVFASNGDVPSIRGDREAIGRALWNLLDNAVKYSLAHAPVRVELAASARDVAIRVVDQGPGIPAGEQRDIFRKFVRGASSRGSNIKGTGLGLAMVQHIVSAHGGAVRLESEPGKGSTFTVVLPANEV